jgi:hypothetical protein
MDAKVQRMSVQQRRAWRDSHQRYCEMRIALLAGQPLPPGWEPDPKEPSLPAGFVMEV